MVKAAVRIALDEVTLGGGAVGQRGERAGRQFDHGNVRVASVLIASLASAGKPVGGDGRIGLASLL